MVKRANRWTLVAFRAIRGERHEETNMVAGRWRPWLSVYLMTVLTQDSVAWICTLSTRHHRPPGDLVSSSRGANPPRTLRRPCLRMRSEYDTEDESDDDDEDDDEPPSVNVKDFKAPTTSYGLFKGRSSPSARKAMGTSATSKARIYICQGCGSEFIKYWGRCPTCKEWNTLQEHAVQRQPAAASMRLPQPIFSSTSGASYGRSSTSSSWLDGTMDPSSFPSADGNVPIRITDLYDRDEDAEDGSGRSTNRRLNQRIIVPEDDEFNNVLGGGLVPGSLILLGGEPGAGKSTLLLQTAASVAACSVPTPGIGMGLPAKASSSMTNANDDLSLGPVWYVSGEETPQQIASRASRLGIHEQQLYLLCETHVDTLCEQVVSLLHTSSLPAFGDDTEDADESTKSLLRPKAPSLIIMDSIQTMVCNAGGTSSPGGITQVRECVALCLRLAKSTGITVVLVGHVTKSGDVAGPKTVEHMVDAVLYLEGSEQATSSSSTHSVRVLRASKNRFGSSDEVGLYEMTAGRLLPVSDPSSLFLATRIDDQDVEGSAICISMEGMRAVAVEVQGLVAETDSKAGYGRRTVDGVSYARLSLLLGVLQKRCGVFLARKDVYVNVVGQLRLDRGDSNGDLAVVMALVSSLASIPVRSDTAFVGEVGLLGELRPVSSLQKRILEARRMGFSRIVTPRDATRAPRKGLRRGPKNQGGAHQSSSVNGIEWIQCDNLKDAMNAGLVAPLPKRRARRQQQQSIDSAESEIPERLEDLQLDDILDDGEDEEESFL